MDGQHEAPCLGLGDPDSIAGFHWGDVNCDGVVNATDALWALLFIAELIPPAAGNCFPIGGGMT